LIESQVDFYSIFALLVRSLILCYCDKQARTRLKRMIAVGHSVEMDIKDLAALNSMFLTGAGRRAFVYILQENIKKVPNLTAPL